MNLRTPETSAWIRLLILWRVLFGVMLSLATILSLGQRPAALHAGIVILVAVLAVWYAATAAWMRDDHRPSPGARLAYLAGGHLVWFVLALLDPVFMLVLFGLFPHIFLVLPLRLASLCILLLSGLTMIRQMLLSGVDANTGLLLTALTTVSGITLAYFIESIIRESNQRHRLLDQLAATQRELAAAERLAGILEERGRLAAEIHDTLAQGLVSIVAHLEAAESALPDSINDANTHIDAARTAARSNLTEARRFVLGLRPESLEKFPFEIVLRQCIADWSAANTIPADLMTSGTRLSLLPEQETALLRITQEALTNITKHANARRVTVTLSYIQDSVTLDIQDDGIGFRYAERGADGFGLIGMRERIERLGGRFTVESLPGEGTTIAVYLPLQPAPMLAEPVELRSTSALGETVHDPRFNR